MEENIIDAKLEQVAGGAGSGEAPIDPVCRKCHSRYVAVQQRSDGSFYCKCLDCGNEWVETVS